MDKKSITLGDWAKDIITGFDGVVIGYATHLSNCDRALIQPRSLNENGLIKDSSWFDVTQLEVIEKSLIAVVSPGEYFINNGDKVEHTLTPLVGTVIGINTWSNGCIRIGIQPNLLEKGLPVDTIWLPQSELKVIEATSQTRNENPGGPMKAPTGISSCPK